MSEGGIVADDQRKVDGHRRAIREHIDKYRRYTAQQDKNFALKTIERIQREIADLKRRNPRIGSAGEDTWRP
jgi:hypothetical protein